MFRSDVSHVLAAAICCDAPVAGPKRARIYVYQTVYLSNLKKRRKGSGMQKQWSKFVSPWKNWIKRKSANKNDDNLKSKIQLGKDLGNQHLPHHHVDGTWKAPQLSSAVNMSQNASINALDLAEKQCHLMFSQTVDHWQLGRNSQETLGRASWKSAHRFADSPVTGQGAPLSWSRQSHRSQWRLGYKWRNKRRPRTLAHWHWNHERTGEPVGCCHHSGSGFATPFWRRATLKILNPGWARHVKELKEELNRIYIQDTVIQTAKV